MKTPRRPSSLDDQAMLARLRALTPRQQAEVVDFIDFLSTRPTGSPLEQHLQAIATPEEDPRAVRKRLAKMSGSMAETVRALRDERG